MPGKHRAPARRPAILTAAVPACAAAVTVLAAVPAWAGSPHFAGTPAYTVTGSTVTVQAREAGLGGEPQIHVVLSGTMQCVNPGGNQPQAANKAGFAAAADEPAQNGKADYTLSATARFQPECSPPMTVEVTSIQVEDVTSGIAVAPVPAG